MRTAIVGATGLVGRAMLKILAERPWAVGVPRLLATEKSAGRVMSFAGRDVVVENVADFDPSEVDLAFFSAGGGPSRELAPKFVEAGAWVVDNSSAWRMDDATTLVVPEINGEILPSQPSIVANPNCSTIQIVMAVAPLHEIFELRQLHVATYQSVSGAGAEARLALLKQLDERRPQSPESSLGSADGGPFARPVAFDAVPEIGPPQEDGSFEEETKVERESRKILGLPDLHVTCLAVRVPSWNGHGAVVRAVFNRNVDRNAAIEQLMAFPGVTAAAGAHEYSTPNEVTGQDLVHVGRLRADPGDPKALTLWVAADNLLKGAALNALQIGDKIVASRFRSGGDF